MASKYENQMKEIGGLVFTSHEYKNRKLRITVEIGKTIYQHFVCTQTWKNAKDSKQSTFNRLSWRFKKYFKVVKNEFQSYLPAIYNPIQKDFIGRTSEKTYNYIGDLLGNCSSVKELNRAYKKVVKYYHPDYLGRELFPSELSLYTWLKTLKDELVKEIRLMEEVFGVKLD